jgi:hypothetical protein
MDTTRQENQIDGPAPSQHTALEALVSTGDGLLAAPLVPERRGPSIEQPGLLVLSIGGQRFYPAWQFVGGPNPQPLHRTQDGVDAVGPAVLWAPPPGPLRVLPGLRETLRAFDDTPWAAVSFITVPHAYLNGDTPLRRLRAGDVARVVEAADLYGQHVAI